jgi:hypothetical protein
MNLKVYRLEHPVSGKGPFHHLLEASEATPVTEETEYAHWLRERLLSTSGHLPSAEYDVDGFTPGVHVCGAPNMLTLSKWFSYYWNRLLAYGFKLYEYQVPNLKAQRGAQQIVFDPKDAVSRTELAVGRNMVTV